MVLTLGTSHQIGLYYKFLRLFGNFCLKKNHQTKYFEFFIKIEVANFEHKIYLLGGVNNI